MSYTLFTSIQVERKIPFNQQLLGRKPLLRPILDSVFFNDPQKWGRNTVANHDDIFLLLKTLVFSQSKFGLANFMFPHFRGKLYFRRRCVTKRNIPHPQSPTPQFRGELVFSATPDLGALVFLASSNLSLLGVAMASAFFLSALAMSRIQIWILLSYKGLSRAQIWALLPCKDFDVGFTL